MLQKNLLSKSLWCNTDTSRLIVIVHVRAVEARDKEGHCAPTEGTARMINDCSLNSPKKRWKSDKAFTGSRGRAPEDIPRATKGQGCAQRGWINRQQPAGVPAACRLCRSGDVLPNTGACVCSSRLLCKSRVFLAAFLPQKVVLWRVDG